MIIGLRCTPKRAVIAGSLLIFFLFLVYLTVENRLQQKLRVQVDYVVVSADGQRSTVRVHSTQTRRTTLALKHSKIQKLISVDRSMPPIDAERNFHEFVSQIHSSCPDHIRVGNKSDGGWDVCLAGPYRLTSPCLVYSFGIGDNWSFDDEVAAKFGCVVRAFDPSINKLDHVRGKNIWFYNVGIGKEDGRDLENGWRVKTLSSLIAMCRDEHKTIDYLKIDIEYNEWDALEAMLNDGILSQVKQLGVEIHTRELNTVKSSIEELYRYWTILRRLELAGFCKWYWHFNIWGFFPARDGSKYLSCCYELVYINSNYLSPKPSCGARTTDGMPT